MYHLVYPFHLLKDTMVVFQCLVVMNEAVICVQVFV